MNLKSPALLALLLAAPLPAFAQQPPAAGVTNIQVIPMHPGVNIIPKFVPDGRDAEILQAWRDNGNAHGYTTFVVMIPQKAKYESAWNIVGVADSGPQWSFKDAVYDTPHTGEDYVRSVRFARGLVDGKAASLLIIAERDPPNVQPIPDPAPTKISIYKMIASDEGVGTTPYYFTLVRETTSKALYCNSELALNKELGLPLPADYDGPNRTNGCFP
jgi:hypothetical protein